MTQPQKFSREFQEEIAITKVFHCKQFALHGTLHVQHYV